MNMGTAMCKLDCQFVAIFSASYPTLLFWNISHINGNEMAVLSCSLVSYALLNDCNHTWVSSPFILSHNVVYFVLHILKNSVYVFETHLFIFFVNGNDYFIELWQYVSFPLWEHSLNAIRYYEFELVFHFYYCI